MKGKPQLKPEYAIMVNKNTPKVPLVGNCLKAFISGGLLCAGAEALSTFFIFNTNWGEKTAAIAVLIIIIALTALVTALGFYDTLAQKLGAGIAVPISGFANSVTASALDSKCEGWVVGVAGSSFKLAGAVIAWGIFSAWLMAFFLWLI